MFNRFYIIFIYLLMSGCATKEALKEDSLPSLSALQLCDQLNLSKAGISQYKRSTIISNLNYRGIVISSCNDVGFSKYAKENPVPITYSAQPRTDSGSSKLKNEIDDLKAEIEKIKIDAIIQKNNTPQETIQQWRERRDKRLRFND